MLAVPASARAQVAGDKEYLVKAAFMYNFVKFVEWPGALSVAQDPNVKICVIGQNPFDATAQAFFAKASTAALALSVTEKKNWNGDVSGCRVMFISASESARVAAILEQLKGKPLLTVSDMDDFAEKGGAIGFVPQDNKIKLVVNTAAAGKAGLRIDAQLLEIALRVIRE